MQVHNIVCEHGVPCGLKLGYQISVGRCGELGFVYDFKPEQAAQAMQCAFATDDGSAQPKPLQQVIRKGSNSSTPGQQCIGGQCQWPVRRVNCQAGKCLM